MAGNQKKYEDVDVLSPEEAADFLGVSTSTIYRWIKDGVIPHFQPKKSSLVRIRKDALFESIGDERLKLKSTGIRKAQVSNE